MLLAKQKGMKVQSSTKIAPIHIRKATLDNQPSPQSPEVLESHDDDDMREFLKSLDGLEAPRPWPALERAQHLAKAKQRSVEKVWLLRAFD